MTDIKYSTKFNTTYNQVNWKQPVFDNTAGYEQKRTGFCWWFPFLIFFI
jgi:hypothetical protein